MVNNPTNRDKNEQNRADATNRNRCTKVYQTRNLMQTIAFGAITYLSKGSRGMTEGSKSQDGQGRKMEGSKDNLNAKKQREYPETSYVSLFINSDFSGFLFGRVKIVEPQSLTVVAGEEIRASCARVAYSR